MANFDGAMIKLDRAAIHLAELDKEIATYLAREPYRVVVNIPPSNPRLVFVEFHVDEQPAAELAAIVGDCVHNLRSSLDHMICDLTLTRGGACDHTQFPIPKKPKVDATGNITPPLIDGLTDPQVLVAVDALQPYRAAGPLHQHPLAVLRDLSNIDKHRSLHLTAARVTESQCFLEFPDAILGGQYTNRVTHHEGVLGLFEFAEPFDLADHPDLVVNAGGEVFVGLDQVSSLSATPITYLLGDLLEFIREQVIPALSPLL